ncbi:MAG: helix-turn-helix domain-containing protein, partial [Methylocella sp.]
MGEGERADPMRLSLEWRRSRREAAPLLGVSVGQFKRLVHRPRAEGDAGVLSRRRGRPPNNRLSASLRARITGLLNDKYPGLAPIGAKIAFDHWSRCVIPAWDDARISCEPGLEAPGRAAW